MDSPSPWHGPASAALKRVGLHARAESRQFMLAVAAELKRRHGSEIHLYCPTPQTAEFYRQHNREGLLASVNEAGHLLRANRTRPRDPGEVIARARAVEARIGTTYNNLMVTNRHLGRGFALAGYRHPRSRYSEESDYIQAVEAYNGYLEFIDGEIRRRDLTIILNGGKEFAVLARANNIPFRFNAGARIDNLHFWAWNEFQENPQIPAAYRTVSAAPGQTIAQPYTAHRANRARFLDDIALPRVARDLALRVAMHMWWRWRGYQKAKGYYLGEELAFYVQRRREWQRLKRRGIVRLADLPEGGFVYYPLHTEPEAALQTLSPEFFYQLSLIAAVARDLPAGMKLAVKETFAGVGRRPADFYGQIADFKNVVLLDPEELGLECVRRAAAVVTICGTGGFEAAAMGKPVIAFGRHNSYNFLPHVFPVTDEAELPGHLAAALAPDFDRAGAASAGSRFLEAIRRVSYDLRQFNYIDQHDFDASSVREACDALEASLEFEMSSVPASAVVA